MKETADQDLVLEWEEKLKEKGMASADDELQEKVPIEALGFQHQEAMDSSVIPKNDLVQFSALPREFQSKIIDDVRSQRDSGKNVAYIVDHVRELIVKSHAMIDMKDDAKDVTYQSPESNEVPASTQEEYLQKIDKIIRQLEDAFREQETIH